MRELIERTPFMATCFVKKMLFHDKNVSQQCFRETLERIDLTALGSESRSYNGKRYVCGKIRTRAVSIEHGILARYAT